MLDDLGTQYYVLGFDETTNAGSQKELQIVVRYWSKDCERIVNRHLKTYFIGTATAKDIFNKLCEALENCQLPKKQLLMISCDGPNVNKSVKNLMAEERSLLSQKPLEEIGTCNIHIMHNAFKRGMDELGENASNLIFQVHDFFHGWPSRWEDYTAIQTQLKVPVHKFVKHVSSRWLSLQPAGRRLLEQWPAVEKYFLTYVPKSKSKLMESLKYQKILNLLQKSIMKAEVLFCCSSAHLITGFTGYFQKDEPLIHIMYSQLTSMTSKIMLRFCSPKTKLSLKSIDDPSNYVPLHDINCGDGVKDALMGVKEGLKTQFLVKVRKAL